MRIPKEILSSVPNNSDHVLPITDGEFRELEHAEDQSQIFTVRKSDLDLNKHVNNVRYVEWALACLPEEYKAQQIDIKFLGEATEDDTAVAKSELQNGQYHFQITQSDSKKVLARAHT